MTGKICFLGGARYSQPLDPTTEKKFRALTALGEIFVIGFSTDLKPRCFTEHARFFLLPQLPLPVLRYVELLVVGQLLTLFMVLRHRVHVIVTQSPYEGFVAALAIQIASWFGCRVKLSVEVHGDFENSLFSYRSIKLSSLYRFLMSRIARYSILRADVLRSISASTTLQLKRWAPGKRIVQFPAWTDIETFLAVGRDKNSDHQRTILYAGVLTPLKGVHHLIGAFVLVAARFKGAQLVIAGEDLNQGYAATLRRRVGEHGLSSRIHFTGPLPQSVLAQRMAEAAVLVLPSQSEGFGRVILEAMAAGTPVIGSRVGGIPELIEDGVNGFLVTPGDERTLADKINWLFENGDQARAMGQAARRFAGQLFSTAGYLHGYREIVTMAELTREQREHAASAV